MPRPDRYTGAPTRLSYTGTSFTGNEHEAILQTLERKSNGLFLPLDAYMPTVKEWAGIPLIFAQHHPDPEAYDADPAAELKRIDGRLVGKCLDAWIDRAGHPRLMGRLGVSDQGVEDGIEDGVISLSTGLFNLRPDGDRLDEPAKPHHILLFVEGGKDLPGDLGTFILNQKEKGSDMADDEKELLARLRTLFTGRPVPDGRRGEEGENMAEVKELEAKLATKDQELADAKLAFTQLQTKMAEMGEAVKAKDAEIAGLRTENLAFVQKEKDAKWGGFKAKHIPPGMVAGDKEKDARKEFEADPLTFMEKVLEFREKAQTESEDGADGVQFTSQKGKPKAKKYEDELRDLGVPMVSFTDMPEVK